MPNHVKNIMNVEGTPEKVKELFDRVLVDTDNVNCFDIKKAFDFNTFIPIPDALKHTTSPSRIVSEEEYKKIFEERADKLAKGEELPEYTYESFPITEAMSKEYIKKYGFDNWYDWKLENWGTKWGAYDLYISDDYSISFNTAWATPYVAIEHLSKLFPDVTIEIRYCDEDFGYNVGEYVFKGGVLVSDNCPEGGSVEAIKLAMDIDYNDYFEFDYFDGMKQKEFDEEVKKGAFYHNYLEIAVEEEQVSNIPIVDTYLLKRAVELEMFEYAKELKQAIDNPQPYLTDDDDDDDDEFEDE